MESTRPAVCDNCSTASGTVTYRGRALCNQCFEANVSPWNRGDAVSGVPLVAVVGSVTSDSSPGPRVLASQGQRFVGFLVDIAMLYVVAIAVGFSLGMMGLGSILLSMNEILLGTLLLLLYYVPQEAFSGMTIGKRLVGTRVVSQDDAEISLVQALGRTFSRCIPFDPLSFLGGGGRPQGWHDRIPGTKVIAVR